MLAKRAHGRVHEPCAVRDGGRGYDADMPSRLLIASSVTSFVLFFVLAAVTSTTGSELTLAQAADSVADGLTGLGLFWALRVSVRPADTNHHYGHHGAQPLAAVIVATLICVMALEVLWHAVSTLRAGVPAQLGSVIALSLGLKIAAKLVLIAIAMRGDAADRAMLRAFMVDARSDVIVGTASLLGYLGARFGEIPSLDAWLAIPASLWVGYNAVRLAHESGQRLMGAAPEAAWYEHRRRAIEDLPGVLAVGKIKAHAFGEGIHLWVEIFVDPDLKITTAHELGTRVEAQLSRDPDVYDVVVQVDGLH